MVVDRIKINVDIHISIFNMTIKNPNKSGDRHYLETIRTKRQMKHKNCDVERQYSDCRERK